MSDFKFEEREKHLGFIYMSIYNWGALPDYNGEIKRGIPIDYLDKVGLQHESKGNITDAAEAYKLIADIIEKDKEKVMIYENFGEGYKVIARSHLEDFAEIYRDKALSLNQSQE